MSQITVEIADLKVTKDPSAVLITYALGSCIAIMAYDHKRVVGGMIHYMLPLSKVNKEKAQKSPAMFADTGVPLLFEKLYALGATKKDLVVKVAGGGKLYEDNGTFEIGKRNYTVLRKLFWKNGVLIENEDVGGAVSRTARLFMDSGRVTIKTPAGEQEL